MWGVKWGKYSSLPNNSAANLILFRKKSNLQTLVPSHFHPPTQLFHLRDWSPKFATGLNVLVGIDQKIDMSEQAGFFLPK